MRIARRTLLCANTGELNFALQFPWEADPPFPVTVDDLEKIGIVFIQVLGMAPDEKGR